MSFVTAQSSPTLGSCRLYLTGKHGGIRAARPAYGTQSGVGLRLRACGDRGPLPLYKLMMNERPKIRLVARFSDVLPNVVAGPLTRGLDRDGVVEHWKTLERIAHLERASPSAAAWCDEQLRGGRAEDVEAVICAAEARGRSGD